MNQFAEIPPALILILGALLVPILPVALRRLYVIALPLLALIYIWFLPENFVSEIWSIQPFNFISQGEIQFLRVDKLAKAFGTIFALNAFVAFIFAFYVKKSTQHTAALIYIGSALGAVFAGDLISLYIFWEMMAVASTIVIISRNTEEAKGSAFRYVMIHLLGGLLLLAGIVITVIENGGNIAFTSETINLADKHWGIYLIAAGILVNAGAVPLGSWLPDSYPAASVTGGLILSAYTTKTSVYALLRGFGPGGGVEGWEPLIWIGCIMSVYGIIYALLENDMRRILAYSIINQVGFMVCAAGIGTEHAVNGATAHAFCHIIYKSLLWMSAGAVLYRVGKSKCTELGGLYKTMPWTLIFGTIGAIAISAVPFTSGYVSKPIIIKEALMGTDFTWAWLMLEIASAGVFLHAGIKFPYFVFFNVDRGHRPKEAPPSMLLAMFILAFFCIFLGIYKEPLYALLPYAEKFNPYTWPKVLNQFQLLMWSALVFFLMLPWLKRTPTISLDFDWFYRKGTPLLYTAIDKTFNGINTAAKKFIVDRVVHGICHFFESAPSRILCALMFPLWKIQGLGAEAIEEERESLYRMARRGTFAIGITAFLAVVLLALLSLFTGWGSR